MNTTANIIGPRAGDQQDCQEKAGCQKAHPRRAGGIAQRYRDALDRVARPGGGRRGVVAHHVAE
jgi:hypothetical protein